MAVSKISLPADFGIENLDCPVHGNIEIKLQEDQKMRANSMILSLHSPVFQNMFFNLGRTSVDLDDFRADVVGRFLAGLYDGKVEVYRDNFREMYKMATVFKIEWLILRCEHVFCKIINDLLVEYNMRYTIGGDPLADTLGRMLWIFEEAIFSLTASKSSELLNLTADLFIKKISSQGIAQFVQFYLSDFTNLSEEKLDIAIKITGENVVVLLQTVRDNICNITETGLSNSCRFLLKTMDLVKCRQQEPELYEEIFDILLENMDKLSSLDAKMVAQLNRQTLKSLLKFSNQQIIDDPDPGSDISYENIINLFHGKYSIQIHVRCVKLTESIKIHSKVARKVQGIHAWIDVISQMKEAKNMYMVFEALFYLSNFILKEFDDQTLEKLVLLKDRRGFSRVNPQFLNDQFSCHKLPRLLNLLLACPELVSCYESRRTVSKQWVPLDDFLFKETVLHFHFPHHQRGTENCSLPSDCCFKLRIAPGTIENPKNFNIQLMKDTSQSNHSELISGNKIHLVAERYKRCENDPSGFYPLTVHLSYFGRPSLTDYGKTLAWGIIRSSLSGDTCDSFVRLVAYVDM